MNKSGNNLPPQAITHDRLLQDCFWWAWNAYPETRRRLWHIPNEIKPYPWETDAQFKRRINYMKAIGVVPGVLDFGMAWGGRYYELDAKIPPDTPSKAQEARIIILQKNGGNGYFFSSLAEFQAIFELILTENDKN